jgi:uncharacterized membrane protein YagU involved in acid resistance
MQRNFGKAIVAGLVGTLSMTLFMLMGPLMGMPEMNIGKMLAGFMGMSEVLGWIIHFMIGTTLALIYIYLFAEKLPGNGLLRGALYGLIPWFLNQIMVNPIMGAGVFASNTPSPVLMVLGSLMGHIVYGAAVGAVYGVKTSEKKTEVAVQQ